MQQQQSLNAVAAAELRFAGHFVLLVRELAFYSVSVLGLGKTGPGYTVMVPAVTVDYILSESVTMSGDLSRGNG